MKTHDLKASLEEKLSQYDGAALIAEVAQAVSSKQVSIEGLYLDYLCPLMIETGAAWQSGTTLVWQEHLISALVRGAIESLAPEVAKRAAKPNGRVVVLACPPEEQHELGLRMLADLYRLQGWQAYYLGADVPEEQIYEAALTLKADTLILSAATHFHRLHLRELINRLKKRLPDTSVLATGPAFKSEHEGWSDDDILDPASLRNGVK